MAAVAVNGATNFIPELNSWLQLVAMTTSVSRGCLSCKPGVSQLISMPLIVPVPTEAHYMHGPRLRRRMDRGCRLEANSSELPAKRKYVTISISNLNGHLANLSVALAVITRGLERREARRALEIKEAAVAKIDKKTA